MKIRITSKDTSKWFVSFYGIGGLVPVKDKMIGEFYELTDREYERAKSSIGFIDPKIVKLFIPSHSAEEVSLD